MSELQVVELILASGAVGLQAPRVRKMVRRVRLKLFAEPDSIPHRVRMGADQAMVYYARLGNAGNMLARACRAILERVEYWNGVEWMAHPGFRFALQLPWSAVGGRSTIDLPAGAVSEELPLVMAFQKGRKFRIVTPMQIVAGTLLEFPPGSYRLWVRVRAEGDPEASVLRPFVVHYDGKWDKLKIRDG